MFKPTHYLVSKTRRLPVQLLSVPQGMKLQTELEWQKQAEPAFEMQPKRGFFCLGIPVLGYSLEPMAAVEDSVAPEKKMTGARREVAAEEQGSDSSLGKGAREGDRCFRP